MTDRLNMFKSRA